MIPILHRFAATIFILTASLVAAPSNASPSTDAVKSALESGCQPWMAGETHKSAQDRLKKLGWEQILASTFVRRGDWGKVSLSLTSDAPATANNWLSTWVGQTFKNANAKPKCDILLSSAAKKWSLKAEAATIEKWVKSAYPDMPAPTTSSANLAGQSFSVRHWQAGQISAMLSLAPAKQSEPNSDLLFRIEDKGPPPAKP